MSDGRLGLIAYAQGFLSAIAADKDFATKVTLAFGNSFNTEKLERLREKSELGDFETLPAIEIRPAAEINGAKEVFYSFTKIYIFLYYLHKLIF